MRLFATLAATAMLASAPAAIAQSGQSGGSNVCTSDQVLGPFLGGLLPFITFGPAQAAWFGVDPGACQTPVEPF